MFVRKGQGILEYTILIGTVIVALLIMHLYIKRTYQGRLKADADSVGDQYSPGHTTGNIITNTTSETTTYTGGEYVRDDTSGSRVPIPYGMTVSKSKATTKMTRGEGVDSFAKETE